MPSDEEQTKYILPEDQMPTHWYNIAADLPTPAPPVIHPGTGQPIGPPDLAPLFPMALIMQEVSQDREIEIPEAVREVYKQWRPCPLFRARRLEKALGTPAKIYYKYEGTSPVGSHKPNTAVAQAYYNKIEGTKVITTETGAGQWGSSMAMACAFFDIACRVFMVRISFDQKPYRKGLMQAFGAEIYASPSEETNFGRQVLGETPDTPGSLGMAISEAVEQAATDPDTKYCLGSVLNHVMTHQSIIGLECIEQMKMAGDYPDIVIGCAGGGSNFAGIAFPFIGKMLRGEGDVRVIAVEPAACPSMTRGTYAFDFGDTGMMTPLTKMHTLGSSFIPPPLHAGGLRYHGMSPMVSHLLELGCIEATSIPQVDTFELAQQFTRAEGILPAPETAHAVAIAMTEAMECARTGEEKTILFNLSGHGHFDVQAYIDFNGGKLSNYEYPGELIEAAQRKLPPVDV
ncbi:MAG: TrpB-like pyridoxal phosphate-dependent enzyme [Candidatus Thalassarchaeaceae archaeon]|nr:TrpB-like pyridoxal phosphate-dependent enzyme [Candidatus Thalassarchaeaceae archaeon]